MWVHAAYLGGEDSQSTKLGSHTVDQHLRGEVIFHAAWELSLYPYHLEFYNIRVDKTEKAPSLLALTHQYIEEDQQVLIIPEWRLLGGYILCLLCRHWRQRRSVFMSWNRREEVRDHPRSLGLALRQPLMTSRKNVRESKGNWSSCSASSIFSAVDFVCFNFTL